MAGRAPDGLTLALNRDLEGVEKRPWTRRALLVLLAVPMLLGLLNVFGQRAVRREASVAAATLSISAPESVRGGLYYQSRFHVTARRELREARLVLDSNWAEGLTINTVEPSPLGSASRNGDLSYELGHVPAGESYVLFVQEQVNPTSIAWRRQRAELYDGDELLLAIERPFRIWP